MNCVETRSLVEDALDKSLAGGRRRAFELHLSRCDACRVFYAAAQEEHGRWFRAMNEPSARRRLPDGFIDHFLSELKHGGSVPQKRWFLAGMLRRIAAALAAMLLFAGLSYAAVVVVEEIHGETGAQEPVEAWSPESSGVSDAGGGSGSDQSSDGESSDVGESLPSAVSVCVDQSTGGADMTITLAAAAALSVATVASPIPEHYNSLAPHTNTENTDFWDTRGYDVEPASASAGVCSTALNRLVRTAAVSENIIPSFRRTGLVGMVITLR